MKKPLRGTEDGARPTRASRGLVRVTLSDQTYEALKERIFDQRLKPGARLNIDALSRELSVSSSPIREALVRLESERLVISELFAGFSVAPQPTSQYLSDLLDYRIVIEGHCARIGAEKGNAASLSALRQAYDRMARAPGLGRRYKEYHKFVQADVRFHQVLVDSADNQVFSEVYNSLHPIIVQTRVYLNTANDDARVEAVLAEHQAILDAFEKHDGQAAEAAVARHLIGGRLRLLAKN